MTVISIELYWYECDECGRNHDNEYTSIEPDGPPSGWVAKKEGGQYEHYCPNCSGEADVE